MGTHADDPDTGPRTDVRRGTSNRDLTRHLVIGRPLAVMLLPVLIVAAGTAVAVWVATAETDQLLAASRWCFVAAGIGAVFTLAMAVAVLRRGDRPWGRGSGDDPWGRGPGDEPDPTPWSPQPDGLPVTDWDAELRALLAGRPSDPQLRR